MLQRPGMLSSVMVKVYPKPTEVFMLSVLFPEGNDNKANTKGRNKMTRKPFSLHFLALYKVFLEHIILRKNIQ